MVEDAISGAAEEEGSTANVRDLLSRFGNFLNDLDEQIEEAAEGEEGANAAGASQRRDGAANGAEPSAPGIESAHTAQKEAAASRREYEAAVRLEYEQKLKEQAALAAPSRAFASRLIVEQSAWGVEPKQLEVWNEVQSALSAFSLSRVQLSASEWMEVRKRFFWRPTVLGQPLAIQLRCTQCPLRSAVRARCEQRGCQCR